MPPTSHASHDDASPRRIADDYVDRLIRLDPIQGTYLGDAGSSELLTDYSPDGYQQRAELARATLARLDRAVLPPAADERVAPAGHATQGGDATQVGGATQDGDAVTSGAAVDEAAAERTCARLLRERLTAALAMDEAGESLRWVSNIFSPVHEIRGVFPLTPVETDEDWQAVARRIARVPQALAGYRAALAAGLGRGLPGGARQVETMVGQLGEWLDGSGGWFGQFAAAGPQPLRADLDRAVALANAGIAELRDWLRDDYAPRVGNAPDVVGRERYQRSSRFYNGIDVDLAEAYEYGWSEFHRLLAEMRAEAARIVPDATDPWAVMRHLDTHGTGIESGERVRGWLQDLMDEAVDRLDGSHFDIASRIRRVESRLAPAGSAPAPYYTAPSHDFSRPGRTWLPVGDRTRFPAYELVSTWYHEGVPGHHLQLAQWMHLADRLSRYQTSVGVVSAGAEGWALYAERLMDELGFLTDPEHRLGYLDAQMMRAVRVVIDIGMHLGLEIPAHSPFHPGERWTPELAEGFLLAHNGRPAAFVHGEVIRYLGAPGQAIGYKLGERVWLRGRDAARRARGADFDLKRWHMAALSMGALGLDDLETELARL